MFKALKPPGYVTASVVISIGGFLNGFDTGSIGPVTEMPHYLSLFGPLTPQMRGFTVSLIMLAGALPSVFAGQLADRFGRLHVVLMGALVFTLGTVLEASSYGLPMFLVGRGLSGLGQGLWLGTVSVYICEIAPSARRGMLVSMPQLNAAAGVCLGYFTCYGSLHMDSSLSWRLPYIISSILGLVLASSCLFLPDSPRWLIQHEYRQQAMRNLERLNFNQAEAEKDVLRPIEQAHVQTSTVEGFMMIFRREYRKKTLLALVVLGMVQMSGIDGVLYYAPTLFTQAGLPDQTAAFLASGVSAILMLAISVPALIFADKWGRRTSMITGGIGLSSCMLLIGSFYASSSVHPYGVARWVVVVLIFAFALIFCFTWGVVGKIYASEIQPAQTRAAANCVAQGLGFFTNWFVGFFTPIFLANSSFGAYFLFGFIALATVAVLAVYMPETRGIPLESIQEAFDRPVMKSWAHHIRRLFSRSTLDPSRDQGIELSSMPSTPAPEPILVPSVELGSTAHALGTNDARLV
ncbi:general substrate transporter [Patellaria atrata CBS 101060]|uniref:General substrate transporter n=1 Tax=Patellaria atrata CBS 101060 TaxID=1346257 RepID=A0A9P4VVP3_9PEZI|nr:general substrate transporter [Patellaria atrata CBS 101060]